MQNDLIGDSIIVSYKTIENNDKYISFYSKMIYSFTFITLLHLSHYSLHDISL